MEILIEYCNRNARLIELSTKKGDHSVITCNSYTCRFPDEKENNFEFDLRKVSDNLYKAKCFNCDCRYHNKLAEVKTVFYDKLSS